MTEEWVVAPEVALTVTLYVPAGVPVNVCGFDPPPQEIANVSASAAIVPQTTRTIRFRRRPEPNNTIPTNPKLAMAASVAPPNGWAKATVRAVVESVNVVLVAPPFGVSAGGLKAQLEAAGSPEQPKLTVPLKPPCGVIEIV